MFELDKLPLPDEMGFFFHPDIPGEAESDNIRELCRELGYEATGICMDYDNPELSDAWHENNDTTAPTRWDPTPPPGDGWILVAKGDTEDGPCAMFVRPISANDNA